MFRRLSVDVTYCRVTIVPSVLYTDTCTGAFEFRGHQCKQCTGAGTHAFL